MLILIKLFSSIKHKNKLKFIYSVFNKAIKFELSLSFVKLIHMKRLTKILFAIFFITNHLIADEGMWMPNLIKTLNQTDMQNSGLQLSADEIYSINNSSLKDAVVALNGVGVLQK